AGVVSFCLAFGGCLEGAVVFPRFFALRRGGGGQVGALVCIGCVVLGVDGNGGDEPVLLHATLQCFGRLSDPARKGGGIVDHRVKVPTLQGRVVSARPIALKLFHFRKQPRIG